MSPVMRKKLERNIQYHAAMAEYHQGESDKKAASAANATVTPPPEENGGGRRSRQPTASASPPKPDADEVLAITHSEVVKQLQDLLDKEPAIPAIVAAEQSRPVRRDAGSGVKPSAGVFH
jgi:hypothetical protein